uniref:Uncharacterized protein n=1 Tax=Nelumbo nucifera TaxID=4432 RepID=A0A822XR31_NELNU|nr:TPA_asm: hypothetical protein HUJ06_024250 [Nelumbo nucifera]
MIDCSGPSRTSGSVEELTKTFGVGRSADVGGRAGAVEVEIHAAGWYRYHHLHYRV